MSASASDLEKLINIELFNDVPLSVAIIDPEFNIVYANRWFEDLFGPWKGRKCFAAYKHRTACMSVMQRRKGLSG